MVHADLSHLPYNDNIVHVSSDKGCHVFRCPRNGMRIEEGFELSDLFITELTT
eukprot:g820.t1